MREPKAPISMNLDEFEQRLLDGDRWIELVDGRFTRLEPPDEAHGDVVRNLSKSLATVLKKSPDTYACFELPLILKREQPTVRCPAISCFRFEEGNRFAETDKLMTETLPVLTVEVASTNDRRESMAARVEAYLQWGVAGVWIIDPVTRHIHQFIGRSSRQMLKEPQVITGHPHLPGFAMPVADIFNPPKWVKTESPAFE
ncbi:Uma2 family endonuclease [Schlesneria sp. T3-172]|uniref:Uma2 family endonuclease n=1 Tax=Schlesneria sphaerica TaxID=3373610 RepID=UPI0037C8984E